jgi:hypothetical protein
MHALAHSPSKSASVSSTSALTTKFSSGKEQPTVLGGRGMTYEITKAATTSCHAHGLYVGT